MQSAGWTILQQDDGWWIARATVDSCDVRRVDVVESASIAELASGIAAQLSELGYRDAEDSILCLASTNCLVAKLNSDAAIGNGPREALSFQLEEQLPISAEQFVADFIPSGSGILGIAVIVEKVLPLVRGLEMAGVSIRSIVPAALLATQYVFRLPSAHAEHNSILIWPSEFGHDVVMLQEGVVVDWLYVRGDTSVLEQNLWMLISGQNQDTPVFVCCQDSEAVVELQHYQRIGLPGFAEVVAVATGEVLTGKWTPTIDLRRESLVSRTPYHSLRGLIALAATAACLLLVSTIAALEYRCWRYEQSALEYQRAMEQVFLQVFPKQQIPLGIRSRLESEHAKTVSLHDTKQTPGVASATDALRELLASLPDTFRYRFTEINVQGRQLKMDGEVRLHGDAANLATALTEGGFEVQPPRTVQSPGDNVSVSLVARYQPDEIPQKDKPSALNPEE